MPTYNIPPRLQSVLILLTVLACTFGLAWLVWQGAYSKAPVQTFAQTFAHPFVQTPGGLQYADSGLPMITAADGFYYLAHAKSANAVVPPLSQLLRLLAEWTDLRLEVLAFWLPGFMAAGMACWYMGWARLLGLSTSAAMLAAAAGSLIPAWVERSRIGWFDTDPLIAFLWHGALWATAWAALSKSQSRWFGVPLLLLCGITLAWWWQPGAIVLPACLFLLGLSFPWSRSRLESRIRLGLALLMGMAGLSIVGGIAALFLAPELLPPRLSFILTYAVEHLRLILGLKDDLIFASIAELKPVEVGEYLTVLGGGIVGGVIVLAALLCFVGAQGRAAFFLLPALGMLALGMMGERFLYLAALPLGLALGMLPQNLSAVLTSLAPRAHSAPWRHRIWRFLAGLGAIRTVFSLVPAVLRQKAPLRCTAGGIAGLIVCLALINMLYFLSTWTPDGPFRSEHDTIAVHLRRASPPGSPVWNWWDDGYFLQARTGLRPLFDGGSQGPLVAWIAARPLVQGDPLFARRWMRFFALRGAQALNPLAAHWGGEDAAWAALERVFLAPNPQSILKDLPPLPPEMGSAQAWLFPEGRVFLYLSHRVVKLSQWWVALGSQRHVARGTVHPHIDVLSAEGMGYNPTSGKLTLPKNVEQKGYNHIAKAYLTDIRPLTPPWPKAGTGPYLVASLRSPWLYMATAEALHSLPLRLLAPGGADRIHNKEGIELEGFAPILVDYSAGGAWEVLP